MALFLEIITGPQKGERFEIKPNQVLGRSKGDIVIKDPKISSKHATIKLSPKGDFILVDNKSSNGIFVNNRKVKKLKLISGLEVLLAILKSGSLSQKSFPMKPQPLDLLLLLKLKNLRPL